MRMVAQTLRLLVLRRTSDNKEFGVAAGRHYDADYEHLARAASEVAHCGATLKAAVELAVAAQGSLPDASHAFDSSKEIRNARRIIRERWIAAFDERYPVSKSNVPDLLPADTDELKQEIREAIAQERAAASASGSKPPNVRRCLETLAETRRFSGRHVSADWLHSVLYRKKTSSRN